MNYKVMGIDTGASEVRSIVQNSGASDSVITNKIVSKFSVLRNDVVLKPDITNNLQVLKIKESPDGRFNKIVAYGGATSQYESTPLKMYASQDKSESEAYYIHILTAIALELVKDNKPKTVQPVSDSPFSALTAVVSDKTVVGLVVYLPVKEYSGTANKVDLIKSKLAGDYVIEFPLLEREVKFTLNENFIGVLGEGVPAVKAIGKVEEDAFTLIIDCGHMTIDVALFKGFELQAKFCDTTHQAGAVFLNSLKDELYRSNKKVSLELLPKIASTGVYLEGKKEIDVSAIVAETKSRFAEEYIKPLILSVLEMSGQHPNAIQNVLPVGGVFNSIGSEEIQLPNEVLSMVGMDNAELYYLAKDLREVNINVALKYLSAIEKRIKKTMV